MHFKSYLFVAGASTLESDDERPKDSFSPRGAFPSGMDVGNLLKK